VNEVRFYCAVLCVCCCNEKRCSLLGYLGEWLKYVKRDSRPNAFTVLYGGAGFASTCSEVACNVKSLKLLCRTVTHYYAAEIGGCWTDCCTLC